MAATAIRLPNSDFISEHRFAELLGKSLRTVRRWRVQRIGPRPTRIGKSVYYSRESIAEFLREQTEAEERVLASWRAI